MGRRVSPFVLLAAAIGFAVVGARRVRGHIAGRQAPGGIMIADPGAYDTHSRLLFGSLYRGIGSDVAAAVSTDAKLLEIGCGPGYLSNRLARDHQLDVTGLDLDPLMIERARAGAADGSDNGGRTPTFIVGDAADLPFEDSGFDLVVSTLSMHHWSDPAVGLTEVYRVLRPGGTALIWDLKPGFWLFHARAPDPTDLVRASPLRAVSVRPWRWPWRFSFLQRWELVREVWELDAARGR